MKILSRPFVLFLLSTVLTISFVSCNNPVSDHEEEHPEPYGFRLVMQNEVVAEKQPEGDLINNFPEFIAGNESPEIEVWFYDFDGELFQPDEPEQTLLVEIGDDQVLQVNSGESTWTFTITALSAGSTTITINLMHEDHPDFTSTPISISVNSVEN